MKKREKVIFFSLNLIKIRNILTRTLHGIEIAPHSLIKTSFGTSKIEKKFKR